MLNNFQLSLIHPNNRNVTWEIVKVFHPDIDDANMFWLKVTTQYEWVILEIKKLVSIGIKFECHLSSGRKPLELFEKELANNKFKAWRFCLDPNCNDKTQNKVLQNEKVNEILAKYNIAKPTAKQMFDYYHSD